MKEKKNERKSLIRSKTRYTQKHILSFFITTMKYIRYIILYIYENLLFFTNVSFK